MRVAALAFSLGTGLLQQFSHLPAWQWSLLLFILFPLGVAFWRRPWFWRATSFFLAGFLWASAMGHWLLRHDLPPNLEGKDVVVEGSIASLPQEEAYRTRFEFEPDSLYAQDRNWPLPGRLLLSWYQQAPALKVGQRWRLKVRLRPVHGFMNPGGFDYEGWLFQQGIRVKGYVREAKGEAGVNEYLGEQAGVAYTVHGWRQALRQRLQASLVDHPHAALITALAIGDRGGMTDDQWDTLTRTGTNHLLAISGLHIGLVAGLAFFLLRALWARSARLSLRWPAPKAAAVAAILAALFYALLAGFSIPTQRALVMVVLVMTAILLQRRIQPSQLLATALLLVLLADPLAVLAPGFWLSFGAVALILLGMMGYLGETDRWLRWGWRWGRVQWVVGLGLFPLLLGLFQQASIVSPLANLVAVPWVTLVTVPLTLLGSLCLYLFPWLGDILLGLSAHSLSLLWWFLTALGDWPLAQWSQWSPPLWAMGAGLVGVGWLLLPRGMPARWLGTVWLLPLFLLRPEPVPPGAADLYLLDVGQGLAAVVRTREHVLVFDTGPRFRTGFNTGEAVLTPFLRQLGVSQVDTLIVSHGDMDHRGGVRGLLQQMPARRVLSNVKTKDLPREHEPCQAGESWSWDGVRFTILHPDVETLARSPKGNNSSCVLRVEADRASALLPADIEHKAERYLMDKQSDHLPAAVMVVPHHGSRTSSTADFIEAVNPSFALFPVGYGNRYGFPKPRVVSRYRERGIKLLDTASYGAICLRLSPDQGVQMLETYRQSAARYWTRGEGNHPSAVAQ
jgi:competence protein ComEC